MVSFVASGKIWQKFFEVATIGWDLEEILVEVRKDGLWTSAMRQEKKNAWAMVKSNDFDTTGEGEFVISVDKIERIIKATMEADKPYEGTLVDGNLDIEGIETDTDLSMRLVDADDHKSPDNEGSSYIAPHPTLKKRWYVSLMKKGGKIVPKRPDLNGENKPFEQMITLDATAVKKIISRAKILKVDEIALKLEAKKEGLTFELNDNEEEIEFSEKIDFGKKATINWRETFPDPLPAIIGMARDDISFAMTKRNIPVEDGDGGFEEGDTNAGLWVSFDALEETTACYLLSVIENEE